MTNIDIRVRAYINRDWEPRGLNAMMEIEGNVWYRGRFPGQDSETIDVVALDILKSTLLREITAPRYRIIGEEGEHPIRKCIKEMCPDQLPAKHHRLFTAFPSQEFMDIIVAALYNPEKIARATEEIAKYVPNVIRMSPLLEIYQ